MKTRSVIFCVPALLLLLAGCGKSEKVAAADSAIDVEISAPAPETADESLPQEADEQNAEQEQLAMLRGLLSVNGGEDEALLRKCCTRKALRQLHDDYEYDDLDGNSLAVWAIDGRVSTDADPELKSIEKVGPNKYQAKFRMTPGGGGKVETSLMEYTLVEENGEWKIDSYRQIYYR